MKTIFQIFYSWQADISENKIISKCLEKAVKDLGLKHSKEINIEINIDRNTKNKTGSPDISNTILQKISNSDIFVCDVTLINNTRINRILKGRLTSNPNVLFEFGYAVKNLGWERTIILNNLKYGKSELLPFDIRNHRVTTFNTKSKKHKEELTQTLTYAIGKIIEDYEEIQNRHNVNNFKSHDIEIFEKINQLIPENLLNDSLSCAATSLFTNRYYYQIWDRVKEFYDITENLFIDQEIHNKVTDFISNLEDLNFYCIQKFTREKNIGETMSDVRVSGRKITEEEKFDLLTNERFFAHKDAFQSETWEEADERIFKLQQTINEKVIRIKKSYKDFIMAFKKYRLSD